MKKIYEKGVDQFIHIKQFDENGDCFIDVDRRYKFKSGSKWYYGEIDNYNRPQNQKDGLVDDVCLITDKSENGFAFCLGVLPSNIYFSDIDVDNVVTPEVVVETPFERTGYFIPSTVDNGDYFTSNGYDRLFNPKNL